jgi:two-component system phosphate regulon sensor histidine kinase PhoR
VSLYFARYGIIYRLIDDLGQIKVKEKSRIYSNAVQEKVMEFSLQKSKEIEQLKKLEQYRKEFLGNVSHELETPIFNIQGYLETLLDGGLDGEKISRDFIIETYSEMLSVSRDNNDLLLISQYESGDLKLHIENYDVAEQVRDIFETFVIQARAKNIDLRFRDSDMKPIIVSADKSQIGRYSII